MNNPIKAMHGLRKPKTWFIAVGDEKAYFNNWLKTVALSMDKSIPELKIVNTLAFSDNDVKISYYFFLERFGIPGDHYVILISPGTNISKEHLDEMKQDLRFTIKKYYKNSELPKIIKNEL